MPLYASIGAGHVRRKLTRGWRRRQGEGRWCWRSVGTILSRTPTSLAQSCRADRRPRRRPFGIDHARWRQRSCVRRVPKGSTCPNASVARDADGLTRRRQPTSERSSLRRFYAPSSGEHCNRPGLRSAWRAAQNVCPVEMSCWMIIRKTIHPSLPHCRSVGKNGTTTLCSLQLFHCYGPRTPPSILARISYEIFFTKYDIFIYLLRRYSSKWLLYVVV